MNKLLRNIRFYVLLVSFTIALGVYVWSHLAIDSDQLQTIRLTQIYALIAIFYLYLAILATPLTQIFISFPLRNYYLKARRAIGVSTFFFALLHIYFAFFGQLGGFAGLFFLSSKYLLAISFSFIAFVILTMMAGTSFDVMVKKLTFPKWKMLHRFVYIAGILLIIHALLLGTHFSNLSDFIPQVAFLLLSFLFILEAFRIDKYINRRFPNTQSFGIVFVLVSSAICSIVILFLVPQNTQLSLGIHAQHIQLAKDAQNASSPQYQNPILQNNPSLQGDKTRRFTVSFNAPESIEAGKNVSLTFHVNDASSGNPVFLFTRVYEKVSHLIIVNSQLDYFSHIHPDQKENAFTVDTIFPHDGTYHLYLDFQPLGAIEQQFAFTVTVGSSSTVEKASQPIDTNLTKTFGNYTVTLSKPNPLLSSELSIGNQVLSFTITDEKTGKPIQTLKPYLAAFGHLVMVNKSTYEYIHVHPTNLRAPDASANGGPKVDFLPLGLYGPIKPGIYRVFAQFNPDNNLFTSDFTIEVK